MAVVTGTAQAYADGSTTSGKLIGYSGSVNRVVRYQFTTGADGAQQISFSFKGPASPSGSTTAATINWYVTTSSTSHISAGKDAVKNGTCAASYNSSTYAFTISVTGGAVKLLPNTTYYLYLFPGHGSTNTYLTINAPWATTMEITLEGTYKARTLTMEIGEGVNLTATKNSAALSSGATVYDGDIINVVFSAKSGYRNPTCTVSGIGAISSGGSFTVSADHTIVATAEIGSAGSIKINGKNVELICYAKINGQLKQLQAFTKINGTVKTLS